MTWLRIRVELREISPIVWRELLVPADLPLPDLHSLLQAAMGWQNSHLHSFARGSENHWQSRPHWVMDDPEGILERNPTDLSESEATVGDLLPAAGSQATYLYDLGDDWEHLLTLTDVLDGDSSAVADLTSPVLTDGGGVCPPEDSGGIPGHEELIESVAALERGERLEEWPEHKVRWAFGTLDVEQIRAALTLDLSVQQQKVARLGQGFAPLPPLLATMIAISEDAHPDALQLMIEQADLDAEASLTPDDAALLTANVRWYLDLIGDEGVPLTAAGYLRPAHVREVADRLHLEREWIGTLNREDQTPGVADFRDLVTALGLIRKLKGKLLLTKAAASLRSDPMRLLSHIAEKMPIGREAFVRQAGALVMLDLLGSPESRSDTMSRCAELLTGFGWRLDGKELSEWDVYHGAPATMSFLTRCGVLVEAPATSRFVDLDDRWALTRAGAAFLRRVLRGEPIR